MNYMQPLVHDTTPVVDHRHMCRGKELNEGASDATPPHRTHTHTHERAHAQQKTDKKC